MPKLAVAIATLGRPQTVAEIIERLKAQTRKADCLLFSVTGPDDLPPETALEGVEIVQGEKGLCAQRNRALEKLIDEYDYIVFFDDDYVPSKFALERIEAYFEANPEAVGIMGDMLRDGIKGPGIPYEEACAIVAEYDSQPRPEVKTIGLKTGLYGCNMAYRVSAIQNKRFDENLPYYGWLEDNDFSNQLLERGKLVHTTAFAGVHCGVKSARSPGLRLGYSQIANPIYLGRKGTLPWAKAFYLMSRNMGANHLLSFRPEPWVDRFGRVKGNWLALWHAVTGRLSPKFIINL